MCFSHITVIFLSLLSFRRAYDYVETAGYSQDNFLILYEVFIGELELQFGNANCIDVLLKIINCITSIKLKHLSALYTSVSFSLTVNYVSKSFGCHVTYKMFY